MKSSTYWFHDDRIELLSSFSTVLLRYFLSNFHVHENHVESGLSPKFSDSVGLGWGHNLHF